MLTICTALDFLLGKTLLSTLVQFKHGRLQMGEKSKERGMSRERERGAREREMTSTDYCNANVI